MIDDDSGVGVAIREATGHLRLSGSLAQAARHGAARRLRRRRTLVASACAVAVSGTAVALRLGRAGTRGSAPDLPAATATASAPREW